MKRIIALVLGLAMSLASLAQAKQNLRSFQFNGCTASPDGWWAHCCHEHDIAYWKGGSYEDRLNADERLRSCMNNSGGPGYVYYDFVRAGGRDLWGRAWPEGYARTDLTDEEREIIAAEKALWHSIGSPARFEFIRLESILFAPLNEEQMSQLREEFLPVKSTAEFIDFYKQYINTTQEEPQIGL